jgi:hypothetical protein
MGANVVEGFLNGGVVLVGDDPLGSLDDGF